MRLKKVKKPKVMCEKRKNNQDYFAKNLWPVNDLHFD